MIRRNRSTELEPMCSQSATIENFRAELVTRRRFLITAAGGSLALLFGMSRRSLATNTDPDPWQTLEAVLDHLLPTESEAPGAREINALDYLRFVVNDPWIDQEERDFILQGVRWLNDLANQRFDNSFIALDETQKETLLRQVAQSRAGENWIATLLTYLFEALLTAPAYGGNPDGIGWRWLEYIPGFPLPGPGNRYMELPL